MIILNWVLLLVFYKGEVKSLMGGCIGVIGMICLWVILGVLMIFIGC